MPQRHHILASKTMNTSATHETSSEHFRPSAPMPEFHDHDLIIVPVMSPPGSSIPLLVYGNGLVSRLAYNFITTPRFSGKSTTAKDQAVKAIGLLHDFYSKFTLGNTDSHHKPERLLDEFCNALLNGTVQASGHCHYGLFWQPKSWEQAAIYIRNTADFTHYLYEEHDLDMPSPIELLFRDDVKTAHHQELKAYYSLLFHLKSGSKITKGSNYSHFSSSLATQGAESKTRTFPSEHVWPMIFDGCKRTRTPRKTSHPRYSDTFNVRNQLAYLLIFFGGLRESNLFHIYANDIFLGNEGLARVNLYHPVKGSIQHHPPGNDRPILLRRQEFLQQQYGLVPRNTLHKKMPLFAGWKSLLLTQGKPNYYSQVHWLAKKAGKLFWDLHTLYISQIRPTNCNHPYYFVSLNDDNYGEPMKISAFLDSFRTSVKRIGLKPSKLYGTTPHGGRHFYGLSAADLKIDPRVRQVMMMHKHIMSQHRYQIPQPATIDRMISEAFSKQSNKATKKVNSDSSRTSFYDHLSYLASEIDLYSAIDAEIQQIAR